MENSPREGHGEVGPEGPGSRGSWKAWLRWAEWMWPGVYVGSLGDPAGGHRHQQSCSPPEPLGFDLLSSGVPASAAVTRTLSLEKSLKSGHQLQDSHVFPRPVDTPGKAGPSTRPQFQHRFPAGRREAASGHTSFSAKKQ